jgi:hypothetical protein
MKWTVVWAEEAGTEVQRVLGQSRFAQRIVDLLLQIDARLASDPTAIGESRDGNERVMFDLPIALTFEVLEERRTVLVTRFRYLHHR